MNFAIVRYLIGWLMGIESLFLLLPAFPAVIYREPELPAYIATALICMVPCRSCSAARFRSQ